MHGISHPRFAACGAHTWTAGTTGTACTPTRVTDIPVLSPGERWPCTASNQPGTIHNRLLGSQRGLGWPDFPSVERVFYFQPCMTAGRRKTRTMTTHRRTTTDRSPRHRNEEAQRDAAWYVLDETADIGLAPSGIPSALRWRGSI